MEEQVKFRNGEYAFVSVRTWSSLVASFNERGDTMGVVPFPRPDSMEPDDPNYRQLNDIENSYAIPRGISPEMTELALLSFREYMLSYYRYMAGSERALDYLQSEESARASALANFFDVTNEDYGDKMVAAWQYMGSGDNMKPNEYFRAVGLFATFVFDIFFDSLYQVNGAPSYAVHVESFIPIINERLNNIQRALDSTGAIDSISPRFIDIEGARIAFPVGTDPASIDWGLFLQVNDNVDGDIDFSKVAAVLSGVDFAGAGTFDNAASFSVEDNFGNEATAQRNVVVFDGENTVPPTLTIKNGYRAIALNEDTSSINWANDFVEAATDKDGLDVKFSVFADLSELNATEAGTYDVTLTVKDYAGNETATTIAVTVR